MNVAIRVLDGVLREDFGFKHAIFVYSGRRGVHCHVADEAARKLTDQQRVALLDYINAQATDATGLGGGSMSPEAAAAAAAPGAAAGHTNINRTLNALTVPLHPSLQ